MSEQSPPVPTWKKVVAGILDFFTVFIAGGVAIAQFTGDMTESGFSLEGWPAAVLFAIVIAYFVICNKFLGGTLWQRVFGINRG